VSGTAGFVGGRTAFGLVVEGVKQRFAQAPPLVGEAARLGRRQTPHLHRAGAAACAGAKLVVHHRLGHGPEQALKRHTVTIAATATTP
jgi:hypothetical protein